MNDKERAVIQQALEAIGDCPPNKALVHAAYALQEALVHSGEADEMVDFFSKEMKNKISVARAEQAEQEPVGRWNWNEAKFEWLTKFDYYKHHMTPLYAAPVRTVDLTDDDKAEIECALNMAFDLLCKPVDSIAEMYCFGMGDCDEVRQQLKAARAVIAKDRELNKCQH